MEDLPSLVPLSAELTDLAQRRLARLGHPLMRWLDAAHRLYEESRRGVHQGLLADRLSQLGAEEAPRPPRERAYLLLEMQQVGRAWRLRRHLDQAEDLEHFVAAMESAPLDLESPCAASPLELREFLASDMGPRLGARAGRLLQALTCWPSLREKWQKRMRRVHWLRVRESVGEEWILEDTELGPGACFPMTRLQAWKDLVEWSEYELFSAGRDRPIASPAVLGEAIAESAEKLRLIRRRVPPEAGPRVWVFYGRDAKGWTEAFGAMSVV